MTTELKVKIALGVLAAIAVIVAAVITGCMKSDSIHQETGRDGTICQNSTC